MRKIFFSLLSVCLLLPSAFLHLLPSPPLLSPKQVHAFSVFRNCATLFVSVLVHAFPSHHLLSLDVSQTNTCYFISGSLSTVVADLFGPAISHPGPPPRARAPPRPPAQLFNHRSEEGGWEGNPGERASGVCAPPPRQILCKSFLMAEFSALYVSRYVVTSINKLFFLIFLDKVERKYFLPTSYLCRV